MARVVPAQHHADKANRRRVTAYRLHAFTLLGLLLLLFSSILGSLAWGINPFGLRVDSTASVMMFFFLGNVGLSFFLTAFSIMAALWVAVQVTHPSSWLHYFPCMRAC